MRGLKNIAGVIGGTKLNKWLYASAAAVTLAVPTVSQAAPQAAWHEDRGAAAHRDDFRRDGHDRDHDNHGGFGLDIRIGDHAPRYIDREVRVWVPPVYRTDCVRVWVPDVYEDREVQFRGDHGRLRTRIEHVLVTPGHYEDQTRQVLVSDGHYETHIEHVKVDDGDLAFRIRS